MNWKRLKGTLLLGMGLPVLLAGCFGTSPPSRFYSLTSEKDTGISAAEGGEVIVRIGPVILPSYLDRRQIVTRSGRNEIVLAEFDRWGGSLDDEISRQLVLNLSKSLAPRHISAIPWRSVSLVAAPILYRIPVSVNRFDGAPGGTVVLDVTWGVIMNKGGQESVLVTRDSTFTEEVGGNDYASLVAAMGKAVEKLGNEIVESISTLDGGK